MDAVAGIFNKLIVAAPFLLVTTFGLKAREHKPSFHYTACSAIENQKYSAYSPIVAETEVVLSKPDADAAVDRKLAQKWISESKSGLLKPLSQIALGDSSRDGVKFEILHDSGALAEALNQTAEDELASRRYEPAIEDATLASNLLKVPRLFDFSCVSTCTMLEKHALPIIKTCLPHLGQKKREWAESELNGLKVTPQELQFLTMEARSVLLKSEDSPNTTNVDFNTIENYISTTLPSNVEDLRKAKSEPALKNIDEGIIDLISEYRLGYSSAIEADQLIDNMLAHDRGV